MVKKIINILLRTIRPAVPETQMLKEGGKDFNPSYIGRRNDVVDLVPSGVSRVLDIGCSTGVLGAGLKEKITGVYVAGIELDERMANLARNRLDQVVIADIEQLDLAKTWPSEPFDCIIMADILEHLKEPWAVLKKAVNILSDDGIVVISIPNIRHYSTIGSLLFFGYWPYRSRGIHDRTHLRFFTWKNVVELLDFAGLKPVRVIEKYRIIEHPHKLNRFSHVLALPGLRPFLTFQYLVVASKKGKNTNENIDNSV